MRKTKWTPGPWERRTDGDREYVGCGVCCIVDEVYATVETSDRGAKERKANAQLIAAAPDLYEALALYVSRGHHDTCQHALSAEYPCNCGHYAAVRSLSKARGEA